MRNAPKNPIKYLMAYFRGFNEMDPWRLDLAAWFGIIAFIIMYFVRFLRPHYVWFDDLWYRIIAISLLIGVAARARWPARFQPYYMGFSWVAIFVSLPLWAIYAAMVRGETGNPLSAVANCFIPLSLMTMLVDWRNLIAMVLSAAGLAALAYVITGGAYSVPSAVISQLPAYIVIIAGTIAVQRRVISARAANEARNQALRDSVGFLAHELNTPLATVRGYLDAVKSRYAGPVPGGRVQFEQTAGGRTGILECLEQAEQYALYCQSLISSISRSAHKASADKASQQLTAVEWLKAVLAEYPFDARQREWVDLNVEYDFALPGGRDLLYLVVCTIIQNALTALSSVERERHLLRITVGRRTGGPWGAGPIIRFSDNGPGIPAAMLEVLSHKPVDSTSGSGMGLVFARRVLAIMKGSIVFSSMEGSGAEVTLLFNVKDDAAQQRAKFEIGALQSELAAPRERESSELAFEQHLR